MENGESGLARMGNRWRRSGLPAGKEVGILSGTSVSYVPVDPALSAQWGEIELFIYTYI